MSLVAASLALGLMAKPMLITLPFILLLLDFWPLGRWRLGFRLIWEKSSLFLLAAASLVISLRPKNLGMKTLDAFPIEWRIENLIESYVAYLRQAAWPMGLAVGYPHPEGSLPASRLLLCAAVLGLISAIAMANRIRRPYLLVGWCWFLVALLPVIGLAQAGSQARADRYTYIPLIGISVVVTWLAAEGAERWRHGRPAAALLGTAALLSLAMLTRRQVVHWKDDLALFSHAVAVLPRSSLAHNGLAAALGQKRDLHGAESELREALRIKPDFMFVRVNLSNLLERMGRNAEAVGVLEDGLRTASASELMFERGLLSERQGRSKEAAEHYRAAVAQNPAHGVALYNWGNLLAAEGRMDEAVVKYLAAWRLNPDNSDVTNNLGMALLLAGRAEAALEQLRAGVEFDPENVRLRTSLGYALSAAGRDAEAVAQFREALRLQPGASEAREALEAAHKRPPR
jgi:tetratricopeptide (TPR) repeat protein